jgi:hypothetical protein
MGPDDELAEMQIVNKRLRAEGILLRAIVEAFDLICGPSEPVTELGTATTAEAKPSELPQVHSPHD